MNFDEYKKMSDFEKTYWWHRGKLSLVKTLVEKYFPKRKNLNILEIGCGTGEVSTLLKSYGHVAGIDISSVALEFSKEKGVSETILADITKFETKNYEKRYDLVLALDVLEHIQDDVLAMKKVYALLKDSGYFFVNVPAHKFLWSEHDEALHHKRRYHSLELLKKLQDSGFKISKKVYFVAFLFPVIVVFRMWNNLFGKSAYPKTSYVKLPSFLNNFMVKILEFECNLIKYDIPVFVGTTIVVVAQKDVVK